MIRPALRASVRLSLHDSIHMIHREDWTRATADASPYLQYDYLLALEDVMEGTMDFRYAIYYCAQNLPMGVAYFQVADLIDNGSSYRDAVRRLGKGIGGRVISELEVRCLVSGNVFHCGDHGSHFSKDAPEAFRLTAVKDTMRMLVKGDHLAPKASVQLFKDHGAEGDERWAPLTEAKYHPMATDVNMVMDLDPGWKHLDDYQRALTSKARTRIRAVLNRSSTLVVRDMSAKEIRQATPVLQALFDQVLDRAPFIFGRLKVDAYARWKEQLGDRLIFRSFSLNSKLVGFHSAFVVGDALDVQYVGIDYDHNQEQGTYQRMLVDLLEVALERKLRRINFGRSAEQAKSNIGALPVAMRFHVKHRSSVANKLIGPFLRSVKPGAFEQRSPFKKVQA